MTSATRGKAGTDQSNTGWVEAYFRSADSGSVAAISEHLSEDAEFRFANAPVISGKAAIEAELTRFFGTLQSVRHSPEKMLVDGSQAVQIATVHYVLLDGGEISLPVATYLERTRGDRIGKVWIFMDLAPLAQSTA